jgi:hypothetical protein
VKRHAVSQPLDDSIRLIPLTRGQNAIVDVADFEFLSKWNWRAQWHINTNSFVACRNGPNHSQIKMHRIILNCPQGQVVDHRNHDTLDNRRQNLRIATGVQNNSNRRMTHANTSGYIGVSWKKQSKKWMASLTTERKQKHLGYFDSAKDAALVRDQAAKVHHGEFARLNFPI